MDSFDIQAFFHLHDLNRDGILDRNEIESIYGVHHEKKRKGAKNLEVHTQQANDIVNAVLERLDQNGDGLLTMREFTDGGVGGLPNFKGVEHLGHHYGPSLHLPPLLSPSTDLSISDQTPRANTSSSEARLPDLRSEEILPFAI